jgi:hypothetical protein
VFSDYLGNSFNPESVPMNRNLHTGLTILLVGILSSVSCKKSTDEPPENTNINAVVNRHDSSMTAVNTTVHPYPITPVQDCIYTPNYGDSIIYPQPASGIYNISPQNTQGIQGTYLSWPAGLVMDANTGTINLTQSQTGQRYDIAFIQYGTTDTCISQLVVAGTAYLDSIYVVAKGNPTASPYFNANPAAPSPCQNSSHGLACQFDYFDLAKSQGIDIDHNTGIIQLSNTVNKIFSKNPLNGTTVNTTIYYKLNDNSNRAPQQIPLQFIYYNRRSDIPPALLATVTARRNSAVNNQLLTKGPAPARPPLIIIVRVN